MNYSSQHTLQYILNTHILFTDEMVLRNEKTEKQAEERKENFMATICICHGRSRIHPRPCAAPYFPSFPSVQECRGACEEATSR